MNPEYSGRDFDLWPGNGFDNGVFVSWLSPGISFQLVEYGPADSRNSSKGYGFYLGDNLTLGRFSLMLGLRAETQTVYNNIGMKVWSWGLGDFLSPRASLAFDLFGDGKNVLKFSYGSFVNPITTSSLSYFNTHFGYTFRFYGWTGPLGPTDVQLKDPANWEFTYEQAGGVGSVAVDPELKPNRMRKYLLEFDHQIGKNWALKIRGVYSTSKKLIDDINLYDPEVEGSLRWVLTNFELKRRDYKAVEIELNGRIADRVNLNACYTWSQAKGTNPGQVEWSSWNSIMGNAIDTAGFGDRPYVPEGAPEKELYDYLFAGLGGRGVGDEGWYGFLPYSVDHIAKLLFVYRAPFGLAFSLGSEFMSGYHWEKKGFVVGYVGFWAYPEGRGVRTTPAHAYVDLAVEKEISLGRGKMLGLGFNIYNLLNSQKPVSFIQEDTELFGQVWGRQLPRWLQFKMTLKF